GPVARIGVRHLAEGLLLTSAGWLCLGAALAAAVRGVVGPGLEWAPGALGRLTAGMALAYVAGFVILVAPGGIGVREFFLTLFLAPELRPLAGLGESEARSAAVLTLPGLPLLWA